MECENIIKKIKEDTKNDNQYNIDSKLLYKIKFRCSCDESGDLQDYRHQNLKLSFDFNNYKITQYVNNNEDLGLLEQYKNYVKNFYKILDKYKAIHNKFSNKFYQTDEYLESQEEIGYLEEEIKKLIINLCYLKIYEYIKKNYKTESYFIYNLKLDIKFIDDLCKYIYFNNYINYEETIKKYGGIYSCYFIKEENVFNIFKKLAYINISGDIYYKQTK